MIVLDGSIRMVGIQFSFSNSGVVPSSARCLSSETWTERRERKSYPRGVMVIEPTERCSLVEFLGELEMAGYELVDAFYKERINVKDPRRAYHMVRFLFARHEFVEISDEFEQVRDDIRTELQEMLRVAMWRVRAFSNPFYQNGEEIPGQRALSVNLEARQPLFRPDGQPVTVWQRDERGRRVGLAPQPSKPAFRLAVVGNEVVIEVNPA
jgi:hypothetical protein